MNKFDHQAIEKKWQSRWAETRAYQTPERPSHKQYVLDMFPYPSGAGLHVGHPLGYIGSDVYARMRRAQGHDVLHPMGWDSFGLPAENYAIKTGTPPAQTTEASIQRFRGQLSSLGLSYDWSRQLATHDPDYYRWTQWLFLKLYERDLAYQKEAPVNWCPKDQTVLANEQVIDGRCDRCGSEVTQRKLTQWFFRITEYADQLIDDLDGLDWPESTKLMQRNWIGRKEGVIIHHKVKDMDLVLDTFSAYPAWLFADTFIVIAPDHPVVAQLVDGTDYERSVAEFVDQSHTISQEDRLADRYEKKGIFTGRHVVDPLTGHELPIWLANFALLDFGTGIIRCSAHDPRDYDFAIKYTIPLREVVARTNDSEPMNAHGNQGVLVDSGLFTGRSINQALIDEMIHWFEKKQIGERHVTYRLRDWLVSRQRYWGAPIPIIHCPDCGAVPVPEGQLPVLLPTDVDFMPTGESPIARSKSFHQGVMCPKCSQPARRESDTLDTFVDSSWYFLRFTDPHNSNVAFDQSRVNQWLPVDTYVGGAEHTVLHLLYSRFITKALADMGYLAAREPFQMLRHQGMIIAEDGRKMSKSLGNVINPDDLQEKYGTDTLRAYEMFMGPFADSMPWSTRSMIGVRRWLDRVWQLQGKVASSQTDSAVVKAQTEQTVKKVTDDIEAFKFNTCISALMELSNALKSEPVISRSLFHRFLQLFAPFAPHLAEELFEATGGSGSIQVVPWPETDPALLAVERVTVAVQMNGKLRGTVEVAPDADEVTVMALAQSDEAIARSVTGQDLLKTIYIPGKVLNLVVKSRKT